LLLRFAQVIVSLVISAVGEVLLILQSLLLEQLVLQLLLKVSLDKHVKIFDELLVLSSFSSVDIFYFN
jgi:hypothetical protein